MKIYKILILIFFMMNGCDNPTSSNIPIEVPGDITNYQSNLYAINSGQHLEEVTILESQV